MKNTLYLFLIISNSLFGQAVNNRVQSVVLPNPENISLAKEVDIPKANHTGVNSPSIKIHQIKAGPLQLAINLSNHSSGLKAAEGSSSVGMFWSLNYGPFLTRTVQGTEDERSGGYLYQGAYTTETNNCYFNPNHAQAINAMANAQLDGEPDIFTYAVEDFSGKFYISANGTVIKIIENDLKIEYTLGGGISDPYNFRKFTVTTPAGNKYVFGEDAIGYKAIELSRVNTSSFWSASAWKINKIISTDELYSIDFQYTQEQYSYGMRNNVSGLFGSVPNKYDKIEINGQQLSHISSSTGRDEVSFVAVTNREDLFPPQTGSLNSKRLDRIEIQSGSFCKKFLLNYQYAIDNSTSATAIENENKKRLILNSIQEKSCDNSLEIPPYIFEYDITNNYLPHKLTAGYDHWGFANGAESNNVFTYNFPLTEVEYYKPGYSYPIRAQQGGANRETNFAVQKLGALKKITYPTGGNATFEYESNKVFDTLNTFTMTNLPYTLSKTSCSNLFDLYDEFQANLGNMESIYVDINVANSGNSNFCCDYSSKGVRFSVHNASTDVELFATIIDLECGQNKHIFGKIKDIFPNIQSSVNYKFRLTPIKAEGVIVFKQRNDNTVYDNIDVGGLRLKQVKLHDGISTSNDIIKEYQYLDPNLIFKSSGVLYNEPKYGIVYPYNYTLNCTSEAYLSDIVHFWFNMPSLPLSSFEGHHIVYSNVREFVSGAGMTAFQYFTNPYQGNGSFPFSPAQPGFSTGQTQKVENYRLSDASVVSYNYFGELNETPTSNNHLMIKAYLATNDGGGSPIAVFKKYTIKSRPFRYSSQQNHKDGLTTTTNLTYRNDKEHLQPIQTETSHSDGTVEKQTIKYAKELNQTDLLSRHMIGIPLESQSFVNNVLTSGQKTNFSLFSAFPRPQTIQTYNTVLSTWETEATFNSYDAFGNPSSVTLRGWQPETYIWNKDLMTQKDYLAFQWKYEYETNTALLKKYTEPNSLFTTYSYDVLSRLSTVNQYSGKAITGLTYAYSPANNTIGINTNYATGADLSTQKIIDGLGRNIKIRKIGYGQGGQDVVSQTDFDPAGRVKKEFLPGFTNPSTAFTEYTYEDSPLGRPISITRPAPLGVETMGYSIDGDFFVETLTNALGEYTKTYTDTRGRKAGTISGKGSLTNTTYNFYDDRNNLIKVRPDGGGDADVDYIYTYTYDGRNRLTSKKIPEKALIQMAYNLRDLPTHTKDGIHPPIYAEYDDYGRNIFAGTVANMSSTAIIDTLAKIDFITNPASLGFGQPFKNKVAVFGANGQPNGQFILSETQFFDSYHRPIYTRSNHILNLANPSAITNTVFYNARDQINSQAEGVAVNGINYSISQSHTYDNGGRKTKTEVSFDNVLNKNIEETTAFDALDKPLQTKIGGNLQTLDYEYFAGGFLDKVNGGTTGAGGLALTANGWPSENSSNDLFAMDLDYLANGNISNWKQQNRGFALQNYTYTYDDLQRITNATDGTFHQAYSYKDALGNFNGIFRNDLVKTSGTWAIQNIDDNAYFYQNPLSSKISSILDYTGSQLGYKANSGTYAYDANGNTTYDPANKLTTLYNYLNLPSKFTKDDGTKQELVYDFSGKKWQEIEFLVNGDTLSKRNYLGSFEFERNSLQKVFHSTGFIQNLAADVNSGGQSNGNIIGSNIVSTQKLVNGGKSEYIADKSICLLPGFESLPVFNAEIKPLAGFQWNYILKDHLGNTRALFADKNGDGLIKQDTSEVLNEVLSLSNYSPFGLELGGSHQNLKHQFDYKFNGKQENSFTGLTDFGARYFDKDLAVWGQIDPSSEKYLPMSTRIFAANLPNKFIDPDGREIDVTGMDVYSQVQLALSLSRITGNNISIQGGKVINKGKVTEEGSPKASSFLDYLISSPQVINVKSVYSGGSINIQEKGKTDINLDTYQIEETFNSYGETQGWGLTFLHEALHTGWSAVYFDKDKYDGFGDPPKPGKPGHDPNLLGETEKVINEFRNELKLVEKSSYFNTEHFSFDGKLINTTWKFGNEDISIKPINKMLLFDKIIRSSFSKTIKQ